ncbi:hypothetical protein PMIT1327_02399 [Prochlorococcus marinus str. MIT 1327]|nr:hypothetical protein PMIT1312_01198 [Prochlorococcus marinus str. MIT 1312]KZR79192.1 hypothetical protein PMIT1327_02399 [Prochlorococcus marinus str. MIT 1327]
MRLVKTPNILLLLTFLVSLPSMAEEEQKKPQKQPELTPVIRAMFSSPRNRNIRVHDAFNSSSRNCEAMLHGLPYRACTGYKGL